MSQSSFEIKTAKHLYHKLVREHERLLADLNSSDHAINFSITAHHLFKDWLKRELTELEYDKLKVEIDTNLKVEMGIIRDVCDGTKHLFLDRPPHLQVSESGTDNGAFSGAFSRDFDIGGLFLVLHDETRLYFDNVADKVVGFWKRYFESGTL
ncbi:MAG: hypothetical protein ACTHLE_14110 [Agriterribacter sp.]